MIGNVTLTIYIDARINTYKILFSRVKIVKIIYFVSRVLNVLKL